MCGADVWGGVRVCVQRRGCLLRHVRCGEEGVWRGGDEVVSGAVQRREGVEQRGLWGVWKVCAGVRGEPVWEGGNVRMQPCVAVRMQPCLDVRMQPCLD
eukprot:353209-Chlamydomonas_euryale.AAC.5